jgi:hypothetical protein
MQIENTYFGNPKQAVEMGAKEFEKAYEGILKNPKQAFKQLEKKVGKSKPKKEETPND